MRDGARLPAQIPFANAPKIIRVFRADSRTLRFVPRTFRYKLRPEDQPQWKSTPSRERLFRELVKLTDALGYDRLEVIDDDENVIVAEDIVKP